MNGNILVSSVFNPSLLFFFRVLRTQQTPMDNDSQPCNDSKVLRKLQVDEIMKEV
jgi:hypothetical protein